MNSVRVSCTGTDNREAVVTDLQTGKVIPGVQDIAIFMEQGKPNRVVMKLVFPHVEVDGIPIFQVEEDHFREVADGLGFILTPKALDV